MKLIEFNAENTRVIRAGVPAIGVNQKTGLFNLNKLAFETLGLKDGDQVVFHQDEKVPENFYLEKVKQNGFTVRIKANVTKGGIFNNTSLARSIAQAFECTSSYRLLLAGEPTMV